MTKSILFLLFTLTVSFSNANAQSNESAELYKIILEKDSLLFNVGFNTCDISQYDSLLSDNFIFYHDKDGVSDKTKFLYDFKNGLCKNPEERQVIRVLVKESTEVFPLYKNNVLYGAVQNGEHLFFEKQEIQPGFAKFTNVWMLENGNWKLTTSISYDHQAYQSQKSQNSVPTLGLGIIENGKLKEVKVFGEIKKGVTAPNNTIFNVASLTKPVTAMVVLRLVSVGKWDLDEPLFHYWTDPDVKNDSKNRKLTTRLVLSHQTGFPNWRWLSEDKKLHFEFEPGTKYQYSGEGFEYLRMALEIKFKKPLDQLANEVLFKPLQMKSTHYVWDKSLDEAMVAIGYDKNGKPYETVKNYKANAADDLLTTVEDYGNFMVAILNGAYLNEGVYQEMIKKQVQTKENKYFGLGFEIYDLGNGEYALSHGGSDLGSQCITFFLPKTKNGILIFTNTDDGYKVYERLLIRYLGEDGKKIIDIERKGD